MDRKRINEKGLFAWGLTVSAVAFVWLLAAAPAWALSGGGSAELRLAQHDKGRTLSGQGVSIVAGSPAQKSGNLLSLPISTVELGAAPAASSNGSLQFKRGKRAVTLSGVRLDLAAGTLNGNLGGQDLAVLKLGAATQVNAATGKLSLSGGSLRLTSEAAALLKQKLGLERALVNKGVGMIWLAAHANPTRVTKPIASGTTGWGVLTSWRKYVLGNQGPGSVGTITPAGGATANGTLTEAGAYFGFPAAGGSFEQGLYGASDKLVLKTQGSVIFAKPGHCIVEVKLADLVVTLDGASSSLALDSVYEIGTFNGMGCTPQPAVATADVDFASLNLTGITPSYSADGKTVTWSAIPATLTAAGAMAFGLPQYQAGQVLDPVTVTVGLG
jgi:hypothetical protein